MFESVRNRAAPTRGTYEISGFGQCLLYHDRTREIQDADRQKRATPIEVMRHPSGNVTPEETAQYSSGDVCRHRAANIGTGELFIDVRHHHHDRSEEHTSELQSLRHLVCRLLL